jgi:hypothetical protein
MTNDLQKPQALQSQSAGGLVSGYRVSDAPVWLPNPLRPPFSGNWPIPGLKLMTYRTPAYNRTIISLSL